MTAYEIYVVLHIVGAVVWVGAAFLMVMLGTRATLARDPARVVAFARDSEWLGLRLFLPANAVVLASAFLVVEEGNWGYDALWIQLGLAGFGLSFLIGSAFFGPGWARVGKIADSEGIDSPGVHAGIRRLLFGARFDLGVLLAIVFVMSIKPTSDEETVLAVAAAIPAAFTLLAFALYRVEARRSPEASLAALPSAR